MIFNQLKRRGGVRFASAALSRNRRHPLEVRFCRCLDDWSPFSVFSASRTPRLLFTRRDCSRSRFRKECASLSEELGPTFVKFGQIVSSRRDLVTDEYYVELCKLQTQVPPFSAAESESHYRRRIGKTGFAKSSRSFDDKPVGSASIAQVHAAQLPDGTKVAVKVQRPDIEEVIELDLAVLLDLARFVERHVPEISGVNPIGVVAGIFFHPAQGTRFQQRGIKHRAVRSAVCRQSSGSRFRRVFRELTTPRVLTMEFLSGQEHHGCCRT